MIVGGKSFSIRAPVAICVALSTLTLLLVRCTLQPATAAGRAGAGPVFVVGGGGGGGAAAAGTAAQQPDGERRAGSVRLVLISDTHTHHSELTVPDGDILIHAGDYGLARSRAGRLKEKASFEEWLGRLPHKHKVFVQGNHDEGQPGSDEARVAHTSTLTDELLAVEVGGRTVKIWGSPWQPQFKGWPTHLPAAQCEAKWRLIPEGLDVLVTHTPPYKYGDGDKGYDQGDAGLLKAIKATKPAISVFGHIHNGWPRTGVVPETGGATTFVNAAVCDNSATIAQPATVIDI